jgi:hypothetical protein
VLKLSGDFKVPDTPDPHWQIVDAKGTIYLLQRLAIKGDKVNTEITLLAYSNGVTNRSRAVARTLLVSPRTAIHASTNGPSSHGQTVP